jgi:hypothetical protein
MGPLAAVLDAKRTLYSKYLRVAENLRDAGTELKYLRKRAADLRHLIHNYPGDGDQPVPDEIKQEAQAMFDRAETAHASLRETDAELRRLRSELAVVGGGELERLAIKLEGALAQWANSFLDNDANSEADRADNALFRLTEAMHNDIDPTALGTGVRQRR